MELQIDMMSYRSLSFIHVGRADFNGFFSKAALQVDSGQLSGFWDSLTIQHLESQIDMMSYRSCHLEKLDGRTLILHNYSKSIVCLTVRL